MTGPRTFRVPYKGINVVMLWSAAVVKGYACPLWLTFKQALELGGHVRKGEAGELVVYADRLTRTETDEAGEEVERAIPFLKGYTVFNAEQCDGLPVHYSAKAQPPALSPMARLDAADRFFAGTGAAIRHGGTRAYYAERSDHIQMPPFEAFRDAESYAATLAHELTHWTKHPSRLARDLGRVRFGDEGYAKEELVAELGSAFLAADLGLTPEVRPDHAAYIATWLKALKDDRRLIVTAASHAQRAVDYLHDLSGNASSRNNRPTHTQQSLFEIIGRKDDQLISQSLRPSYWVDNLHRNHSRPIRSPTKDGYLQ